MFSIINISLGRVKVGKESTIIFPYSNIESIISVISSCDCAVPVNNIPLQQIIVKYTCKGIPPQLQQRGLSSMNIVKTITVEYFAANTIPLEKRTTVLSFNATIYDYIQ